MRKFDTLLDLLDALPDDVSCVYIYENDRFTGYEGGNEIDSIDFYHPNKKVEKYIIYPVNRGKGFAADIWIH